MRGASKGLGPVGRTATSPTVCEGPLKAEVTNVDRFRTGSGL